MSAKIVVKTYLKDSEQFIPYSEFENEIKDPDYIEGAIELSVEGVPLLTLDLWDYVDQLWAYIVQGLQDVAAGQEFFTHFPDQPIELKIIPVNEKLWKIKVKVDEEVSVVANRGEFVSALSEEAKNFFEFLSRKVPQNKGAYEELLSSLEKIHK